MEISCCNARWRIWGSIFSLISSSFPIRECFLESFASLFKSACSRFAFLEGSLFKRCFQYLGWRRFLVSSKKILILLFHTSAIFSKYSAKKLLLVPAASVKEKGTDWKKVAC